VSAAVTDVLDIILASSNSGKRKEFDEILALSDAPWVRIASPTGEVPQVAETGRSYRTNARLKARVFASQYNSPALGDDSGLSVDALGGAPGLHTARFGGPGLTPAQRVDLLLERLRDVPDERRGAHFVCVLCLVFPDGAELFAQGRVFGQIARQPAGAQGFGYDPIFLVPALGCTLAQLQPEQKHAISHRGRAVRNLLRHLKDRTA
jgi:XTP/dITP diphosphohydrolase